MGHQIIKQPDGKLAIFDASANVLVYWNATEDEIIEWFVHRAAQRARDEVTPRVRHVAAGNPRKVYFQFVMSWEEALGEDRRFNGGAWKSFRAS